MDAYAFQRPAPDLDDLNVEFADSVQEDVLTLANTVNVLNQAVSASIETRVRMLHPEWDEDQVKAEVALIREDQSAAMPAPFDCGSGGPTETDDQRAAADDADPTSEGADSAGTDG